MPSNKKINDLLTKADKLFEKQFSTTELKVLKGYKLALDRVQGELEAMFAKYGKYPTITELRKFKRYDALEKQLTAIIAEKQKIELNTIASAKKNALLSSYESTGFAIETGTGVNFDFTMLPQESIDFVLSNDLWVSRVKNGNAELLTNIKDEITKTLRENAREEVGAGLAEGKSYAQVSKAIKDRFNISANRARTITFDQMHAGHMEGRNFGITKAQESGQRLGLNVRKVWIHYPGASKNPRPDHALMGDPSYPGHYADENGIFTLPSGSQGQAPGLMDDVGENVNCHCGASVEIEGIE